MQEDLDQMLGGVVAGRHSFLEVAVFFAREFLAI